MDTRKQQILVITIAAVVLIFASITGTWLLKTGRLGGSGQQSGYQNVTFTDAVLTCEKNFRSRYADRILSLEIDNHSSRFDNKVFLYKIFIKSKMTSKNNKHGNMHFVNCFVKASNGSIDKFEVLEETEVETEAVTGKETNAFGWPK